jgi:signal transduction histidine kinase
VNDSISQTDQSIPEHLFAVRRKLEDLTRLYVDKLIDSSVSASNEVLMLNAILDSIGHGLVVFDKDENIILANREAARIVGAEIDDQPRRQFLDNYKFFEANGLTPLSESEEPFAIALREKKSVQKEGFVRGPNIGPEGMWLKVNAAPVLDENGEVLGVVTIFQDITETKLLQRQRDSLATLFTHDLKNHLVSIGMFLEVYGKTFANTLGENEFQLLTNACESNKQFLQISNSLIELHRTDLYAVESCRSEIALNQLLSSALELNRPLADARKVQLLVRENPPLTIHGISSGLRQVFHNLFQNAIKASPVGGIVEIVTAVISDFVQINITDHGCGISEDQIRTLFKSSRVASSAYLGSTSTGFGLYLCRLIVEAHGGKLLCESQPGTTTTFSVRLPL